MKLPHRRQFLHLAAGAAALPAVSRIAGAQTYPTRPVRIIVALPLVARPTSRAPDGPMAVGAARPTIHHREPAGRRQQHRHRSRRESAAGRLHAPHGCRGERDQRDALRKAQFQFHPRHRAGRKYCRVAPTSWWSIHRPSQDRSRIHRLCQGQSGQDQHGSAGIGTAPHVAGELFKMMAGINMVHVPYRGSAPRTDLLSGQVQVMFAPCLRRSGTSGRHVCAHWR